jgi:hypothetical protein
MPNDDEQYEVGYGKPPKSRQFTKGRSGNPKGRPKGTKNFASVVLKESRQPVRVNGPRGTRTVTKLEAAVMQIVTKAAQGELRAAREFFHLVDRSEQAVSTATAPETLGEMDQLVVETILRRMNGLRPEPSDVPAQPGEVSE